MEINKNYQIINGDAYIEIDKLIENRIKVNHIITDPPYNISKKNNLHTLSSATRQGVDFGEWDKDFDLYSWIGLYGKLILEGGSFIIFTSYRFISYVVDELEKNGFIVKDILKWIKTNPMPRNISRRYVQDTEYAVWAVTSRGKWVFNKPESKKYLRAEFKTAVVSGNERTIHPTQKSIKLMNEIINIHTNKNDIILDPFMGSGTTGAAALLNERKFIGIELDKEYFNIACERLSIANSEISLF